MTFLLSLLVVLAALLWFLSIPVDLQFKLDTQARQKLQIHLRWFYGLLKVDVLKTKKASRQPTPRPKAKTRPAKAGGHAPSRFVRATLITEGFIRRLIKCARDCLWSVQIRDASLNLRLGLADAAHTGCCAGVLNPLWMQLRHAILPHATLEMDFEREIFILNAGATLRMRPLNVAKLILLLLLSPEMWRGIRNGIRAAST